jgi:hypothetical protein
MLWQCKGEIDDITKLYRNTNPPYPQLKGKKNQ